VKITIESTSQTTELRNPDGAIMPARIWQGETETGIPVVCFITRVAVPLGRSAEDYEAFARELQETAPLKPELPPIDRRYVL
jgi:hypothetical protein